MRTFVGSSFKVRPLLPLRSRGDGRRPSAAALARAGATLIAMVVTTFVGTESGAAVTVIDVGGASNKTLPTTTTDASGNPTASGTTTIYGGLAGVTTSTPTSLGLVDTCATAVTLTKFPPCNKAAITNETILTITINTAKGGYVIMLPPSTSATTTPLVLSNPGTFIPANGQGTIQVRWGNVCAYLSTTATGGTGDCSFSGTENSNPSGTFTIGVATNSTDLTAAESTQVTVTIATVVANSGQDSVTGNISSANNIGLNQFSIGNGDSKIVMRNLNGTGVPQGSHLTFQYIRLLSEEVQGEDDATIKDGFERITASSNSQDLQIDSNSTGDIQLTPARVTGFSNDHYYVFKVGMVDLAGNVGFFTESGTDHANDLDCTFLTDTPAIHTCHVGHPGEVVGVLSKDLNCFVATAAYGSPMAPQVETFRQFRNRFLLTASWGRRFVKFYYAHSPTYAAIIAQHAWLRTSARLFLWPLLAFAWLSLHGGLASAFALAGLLLGAGIYSVLRTCGARRA